jgi:two-component system, OmpR family, sensor histidine kinase MprB
MTARFESAVRFARSLSLRARIALLAAVAVAIAIVASAAVAYAATRAQLRGGIDDSLRTRAELASRGAFFLREPRQFDIGEPDRPPAFFVVQFVTPSGNPVRFTAEPIRLPVDSRDVAVAQGAGRAFLRDVTITNLHMRILTAPIGLRDPLQNVEATAVQIARPLTEVDSAMRGLALVLFFVALGGVGLASGLGVLVARSALQPVQKLTDAAEHVARTQDLSGTIDVDRDDEIGRLAASFNAMLQALSESRDQQQRLITDASHELRTPLTSVRTNIEVLSRITEMDPAQREKLLADLNLEMTELTNLVGELVELATAPGGSDEELRDVRLDELADVAVRRARFRSGQHIELDAEPTCVHVRPAQLERAVSNVLHNATKWNPTGNGAIKVTVRDGRYEVRDHGPGIGPDDLSHVFDRFYRAPGARATPGSGLGLAITKQVIESHGGRVWALGAEGGGALVGFELPTIDEGPADNGGDPDSRSG